MALVIAMGPKKKGPKMKKEDMLLDDEEMGSEMDEEDEFDDLEEDEDEMGLDMDEEEEDSLFDGMEESDDSDLEMLVEDVISAFESKDTKQLMMALKDFVKSVMGKE